MAGLRVLLADDEPMVRSGARMMLEADEHEIVGEAGDGEEAVRLARSLRPDVVLMDIRMPRVDGIQATRLLAGPDVADPVPVIVLTTFDLDENVHAALRAGASGFLLKNAGPRLLAEAVRAAADGGSMIAPSVTTRLLEHFAAPGPSSSRAPSEPLTGRETEVVAAVASGDTNPEIAERLVISLSTVKVHVAAAQRKIGARNRTEIAVWAWETGLARRG
ncbi:response regulator [Actinomycetospora termitidis]|uniref:Response regulator transcription factor n=1 Tax=Actinomycetospora termitidis TaxID=3053470 RepID=A0ABT7M3H3_9PSEU|nr:response regulator transcription factor [Actinomycetospora sp. Odt1-22]MDL5155223.1 response regulator transcription factor [Actinomycetospora sp. Odt1-22]